MENTLNTLLSGIPANLDIISMLKFIGVFAFLVIFIGLLGRVIFGRFSGLNHAVSSAMGILFVYALTIIIYTTDVAGLSKYLAPLPFVKFSGNTLHIYSFLNLELHSVCREVLNMVILAFLVNLLDTWIPKGKKFRVWLGFRILTVLLATALHYLVRWAFNAFLPGVLVAYAPTILLCILGAMLFLGLANTVLSLVLTVVNPIIGALYAFFFSTIVGKQLSKALVTTGILCAVVYALNYLGYSLIAISAAALVAYIPMIVILLILWYIIGHML